jgi:vancomycin resistance protein YoaR
MPRYAQARREGTVSARFRLDGRRRVPRRFGRWGVMLGFTLAAAAASLGGLGYLRAAGAASDQPAGPSPAPRVASASGVSHPTPRARAWLRETFPSLSAGRVVLVLGSERRVLAYRSLGRDYDVPAILGQVPAALAGALVERSPEWQQGPLAALRALLGPAGVEKRVRYEPAAVERAAAGAAASLRVRPRDAAIGLSADGSRLVVKPASPGREVDTRSAIDSIVRAIHSISPRDVTVRLHARRVPPRVSTAQVRSVVGRAERDAQKMARGGLELVGAPTAVYVTPGTIRSWMTFVRQRDGSYLPVTRRGAVERWLKGLARRLDVAPRNASLFFAPGPPAAPPAAAPRPGASPPSRPAAMPTRPVAVGYLPSANGRRLEVGSALERVLTAVEGRRRGVATRSVRLEVVTLVPDVTSEEAARLAPRIQLLSRWTTNYVASRRNFFGANIRIPTSAINGEVVQPGQWFDFWGAVGPISRELGYGDGGVIRNGRTEPTGALGGGICSVSTTLFNAAARAGLQLGERHNHYYYIPRYPLGLDATVLRSSGGVVQNMTFRNDTQHPVIIRGINSHGGVTFEIYGMPTGRTVTFSQPVVQNRVRAGDSVRYSTSLPRGRRERVEYPADGMDVWVTRTVRDATGRPVHQNTFYSHYGRVTGVVLVGR